jgi:hypothetical protein
VPVRRVSLLLRAVRLRLPSALATLLLVASSPAFALDKQGSAHGGAVGGGEEPKFGVSGTLAWGVALVNPTYAARPDNTGLALFRYAGHADVDLLGRKLSIPLDLNLFTDRERKGAAIFAPSELDLIGGVTTTNSLGPGDLELGARGEHDRPVDRLRNPMTGEAFTQTYADVRARYLYSLAPLVPGLGRDLVDGDLNGNFTLGWFAINPTYAARPDNTGIALLRYAAHSELDVWHSRLALGVDFTFFTDRRAKNPIMPAEVDLTYEVIGRPSESFEVHLAYERDMPIGNPGLVQSFVYAVAVYKFDLTRRATDRQKHVTMPSP